MTLNITKLWFLLDGKWLISMASAPRFLKDRIFSPSCNDLKEAAIILERTSLSKLWQKLKATSSVI